MKEKIIVKPMNPLIYQRAIDDEVKRFKNMQETEILAEEQNSYSLKSQKVLGDDETVSSCETVDLKLDLDIDDNNDNVSVSSVISEEKRPVEKVLNEDYGYLLSMQIRTLTQKKFLELQKLSKKKNEELEFIKNITPDKLWLKDLEELESKL